MMQFCTINLFQMRKGVKYLSAGQERYLSPGCLKLFSFSMQHCEQIKYYNGDFID